MNLKYCISLTDYSIIGNINLFYSSKYLKLTLRCSKASCAGIFSNNEPGKLNLQKKLKLVNTIIYNRNGNNVH